MAAAGNLLVNRFLQSPIQSQQEADIEALAGARLSLERQLRIGEGRLPQADEVQKDVSERGLPYCDALCGWIEPAGKRQLPVVSAYANKLGIDLLSFNGQPANYPGTYNHMLRR